MRKAPQVPDQFQEQRLVSWRYKVQSIDLMPEHLGMDLRV